VSDDLDLAIPDFTEEFVGWRGWTLTEQGRLCAIVHEEAIWEPGDPLEATCSKGKRHPVPFMGCSCGFYCTKTYLELCEAGYAMAGVWGTVSCWGKSIDSTMGYRTRFAYPREIWLPYTLIRFVEPLAEYGVPVRLANPYTFKEPS
jgi:hypothetical protein